MHEATHDYFNERLFPPVPERRTEYERRVRAGRERMARSTGVIVGLARNIEARLPHTITGIEALGAMFADHRVVIYENDSTDRTAELLKDWAARRATVDITCEHRGDPVNPTARCLQRAGRMARYRNACLDIVRKKYAGFDYTIVVDTDLAVGWSLDGVANTFGHENWDFVGSNGLIFRRKHWNTNFPIQYDAWAFRLDEQFTPLTTREVNDMWWRRGEPLVTVTCSFGGLGVYRMPAYLAGRYAGNDIEHVTHQMKARAAGFRQVFLNPSQITVYGRHRRKSDGWVMPALWLLTGNKPRG